MNRIQPHDFVTGSPASANVEGETLKGNTMEVHFTPEQEARLTQVARGAGTDAEELVKDATLRMLNRRRYTAAELVQQHGETPLSDEDRAWLDAPPLGREAL